MKHKEYISDYLVIGSGVAGLWFALNAATKGTVVILTKNKAEESNTRYAQGGIACVCTAHDNEELHVQDTLEAGAGLCNEERVRMMVRKAPDCIRRLQALGAKFTADIHGNLMAGREGGHSENRIVHALDATGPEVLRTLLSAVRNNQRIQILEDHVLIELSIGSHKDHFFPEQKKCYGAVALDVKHSEIKTYRASATLICTGGSGQIFQHTTNPEVATGDGVAIAARAGALVRDMEFIQFHPTVFCGLGSQAFLISEALRGAGAVIRNTEGIEFLKSLHPLGSLAPRDVVSRGIFLEMQKKQAPHVFLDATKINARELQKNFPTIYATCLAQGVDCTRQFISVVPAAHYQCGGIETNSYGESSIINLYAAGEAACTGVHGANRLASNSLLEALVFADRAAESACSRSYQRDPFRPEEKSFAVLGTCAGPDDRFLLHARKLLKQLMSKHAGIIRNTKGMKHAVAVIESIERNLNKRFPLTDVNLPLCELRNLLTVSSLILTHALKRKQNAGGHFNQDLAENSLNIKRINEKSAADLSAA